MTARDHNNLLGIFILIQGGIVFLTGLMLTLIYGGVGLAMLGMSRHEEEMFTGGFMLAFGLIFGIVMLIVSSLYLFTGLKIRKQRNIGRILGIVVSILSLFSFPLGTALGIYGLWFFFGDAGKSLYSGMPQAQAYTPPPPPNSWQ